VSKDSKVQQVPGSCTLVWLGGGGVGGAELLHGF
jgi:hypothetical protein